MSRVFLERLDQGSGSRLKQTCTASRNLQTTNTVEMCFRERPPTRIVWVIDWDVIEVLGDEFTADALFKASEMKLAR